MFLDAPRRARRIRGLVLESLEDRLVLSTSIPLSTGVWTALGPAPITSGQTPGNQPVSGDVTGVATNPTNPQIIYVATSGGGVWKTFNGGSTWFPMTDTQATLFMGSIAVAPTNPSVIYAGTGNPNSGTGGQVGANGVGDLQPNDNYGLGLLVSQNGGSTWTLQNDGGIFTGQSISKIVVSPTNPNTLYVAVTAGGVNGVATAAGTATVAGGLVTSVNMTNAGGGYTSAPVVTLTGGGGVGATAAAVLNGGGQVTSIVITSGGTGYTSAPTVSIAPPTAAATGIYMSTDGGSTWTNTTALISTQDNYTDLVMNPANPENLYFAIGTKTGSALNGVYGTVNGGATWAPAGNFPGGTADERIALGISSTLVTPTLYAAITQQGGTLLSIEKSTDGGNTWSTPYAAATPPPAYLASGNQYTYIAVSPTNPNTVFAAGGVAAGSPNSIIESTNGGSSWSDISIGVNGKGPHVGHDTYAFGSNGLLYDGNAGGIWQLTNPTVGAIQWTDLNGDLEISEINGLALTPNNSDLAYASAQGNGIEEFNDSLSWTELQGGDGGAIAVDNTTSPPTLYRITSFAAGQATNAGFLQQSINGGASWTNITTGINIAGDNGGTYPPLVLNTTNPSTLLVGTNEVYETTDQGLIWTPISFAKIGNFSFSGWNSNAPITALAISQAPDPNTGFQDIYAATADGHIFVSSNNGSTWVQRDVTIGTNYIGGPETQILVDPNNPDLVYTVRAAFNSGTDAGHVFMSTNAGQTWTDISGNLPNLPTWSIAVDSRPTTARMYVGTDNGVYSSSDGGVTWTPYKTGMPNAQVTQLLLDPTTDILAAGTDGRGVYEIGIQETIAVQVTPPVNVTAGQALNNVAVAQFTDLVAPGPESNYTATINWGNGNITSNALLTPATGGGFLVEGSNTYSTAGTYTISVTVESNNGNSGQNSTSFNVADAALTTPATFAITSTEGQTFSGQVTTFQYGNLTATAGSFTGSIAWGNGNTSTAQIVADAQGNGVFDVDGSNFYNEYTTTPDTVTVTITDSSGTTLTASGTATITDAPLFSTPVTFVGLAGTTFSGQVATFTDSNKVGVLSDYSATINWGDGTGTSTGTITSNGPTVSVSGSHLYKEAASYPVTVTIDDKGGASTTAASTGKINDAALVATATSVTASKGVPLAATTVIATFTDGNSYAQATDFSATAINWGDGSPATTTGVTVVSLGAGKFSVQATHTYSTPGTYTIATNIVSSGGSKVTARSTALVADVPVQPLGVTITPPGGETVVAGSALNNVLVATFTDPYNGQLNYYSATIDWGDSTGTTSGTIGLDPLVPGQYDVYGTHTYPQAGNFTVTVNISDGGGGSASVGSPVQVVAAPLVIQTTRISPVVVGNTFSTVVASFTDPDPFDTTGDFTATINWGNGTVNAGQIVAVAGGFNVRGTNNYSQLSGPAQVYPLTITIVDENASDPYVVNNTITVQDATIAPVGQTISAVQGTAFNGQVASFVDGNPLAPLANFTASISWGDGNTSAGSIQGQGGGQFTVSGSNTYVNPGNYPITVSISDIGGNTAIAVSKAAVAGAALTPAGSNAFSAFQGTTFSGGVVEFNDAYPNAPAGGFSAVINWGNGNIAPGTVNQLGGGVFQVTGSNFYANAGSFPVTVMVTGIGGSNLVLNTTALVLAPLKGSTGNGGFTNNTQPTFSGTAQPGAVISLFVSTPSGTIVSSGRAVVNAAGQWSAQVGPALANGTYGVTANMVTSNGVASGSISLGTIQIDTQGPNVAGVTLTPATRQLRVTFQDASGMNPASIANAGNYVLSAIVNGRRRNFGAVALTTVAGPGSNQVTAIITYNLGAKPPTGAYVVTLNSLGLTDNAGNTLVETHFVTFPQTSNVPNPNYVAQFNVNKHLVASGPIVYVPAGLRAAASRFRVLTSALKIKHR
jgi:hypothetical protein